MKTVVALAILGIAALILALNSVGTKWGIGFTLTAFLCFGTGLMFLIQISK